MTESVGNSLRIPKEISLIFFKDFFDADYL